MSALGRRTSYLAHCGVAAFVICLLATAGAPRALAAVLPQARIKAAFASAKSLHRAPVPNTASRSPYYKLAGSDAQGFANSENFDYGFLANGADAFIVPLDSGGSGGVFFTLLFTSLAARPRFVGVIPSDNGHLDVHIERGQLLVRTPIYGKGDPNCCPSGHHVISYTLINSKLKKLNEYGTR